MILLLLMSGAGSRFYNAGYTTPKPLIEINGKKMYELVLENMPISNKTVIVSQKSFGLSKIKSPEIDLIEIDYLSDGPASSALAAKHIINTKEDLLIVNCDQLLKWDPENFLISMANDGGLVLFKARGNRWSFAKIKNNLIVEVAEKNPISEYALAGIHYWRQGSDFVKYAEQMIHNNERVNGEFYIAPVYNYAIKDNLKITAYEIDSMTDLGTPEGLLAHLDTVL